MKVIYRDGNDLSSDNHNEKEPLYVIDNYTLSTAQSPNTSSWTETNPLYHNVTQAKEHVHAYCNWIICS